MCTVVVQSGGDGGPARVLALRDELVGRAFDDPGAWWPEQPQVVGGRDRTAGGSWCVTSVPSGATALVLNRPQRRVAAAGAPSRGVLPLLAVAAGVDWPDHLDPTGMASFALVLVRPHDLTTWEFDGSRLTRTALGPGTHLVTSGGAEDGKAERHLATFRATTSTRAWRDVVTASAVEDDPTSLLVRHETADAVFATVFAQVLEVRPGHLDAAWSRTPTAAHSWQQHRWTDG